MNDLFAIGIPTINRADLLNPTLEKYLIDFPNTLFCIVDNGNQALIKHERIRIFKTASNFGVAKSWNVLQDYIFSYLDKPYALILNDDIYLGKFEHQIQKTIEELSPTDNPVFLTGTGTWCSFISPAKIVDDVGDFDEGFLTAYYEDNDYSYRLKLAGHPHFTTKQLDPLTYINSGSLKKDSSLNANFEKNKRRYIEKWGGMEGEETYTIPFNKPE